MKAPFKMKYSPVKGRLGDFFKKATPETKAKRAEAKKTRKAGESQYQADVRTKREANRASKKAVAAKPTKNATKNATKNKPTDKEIKVDTKNNLTLGSGSTPKMKAPFKMSYSPMKGKLDNFFKTVTKKATPETKLTRAKAKKTRKAGESQYQADVRTRREANRASKKTTAAKPTKNATKNKSTDKEITVSTKNNLTLGGSTPKMGNAGDQTKKGTGKYKDNTYTRSGKTGSTSVVTKGGKRTKVTGDIKDYTKEGGNTKIKVKAKEKEVDLTKKEGLGPRA